MIDDVEIPTQGDQPQAPIPFKPTADDGVAAAARAPGRRPPQAPRLRKLRLLLILLGLAVLAVISTVFGMMMAVASDLPQIENRQEYRTAANSYLYDDHWHLIGLFAPPNHEVIDSFEQISPWMRRAIVSVEDQRFWTRPGGRPAGASRARSWPT